MDSLDLDIRNYSINDLLKFFKFSVTEKLDAPTIELRETEIRELLLSTGHINKRFKRDLIAFLEQAKDMLIKEKCGPKPAPSLIKNIVPLDPNPDLPRLAPIPPRTDELTQRDDTSFVYSMPGEYYPGNMNPLKTRVITKNINIDTRFHDTNLSFNSADFTISLPQKFNKIVSMEVSAIEFPLHFYNISHKYGNTGFNITVFTHFQNFELHISVPDGNYSNDELLANINMQIQNNSTASYFDLSFNRDANTGKVKVNANPMPGVNISNINIVFNGANSIGTYMGFIRETYNGSISYVSETMPNSNHIRYLYLAIDDFNNAANNHFISAFHKSTLSPHILLRMSIADTPVFDVFVGNELNTIHEPRKYFGPVDIQKLHVQIYDDMGRIIDLNNSHFSFCLTLKQLYDL